MLTPLVVLLATQAVFTCSDLMGRHYMKRMGFHLATFVSPWFFLYLGIRQVATFGQLYAFVYLPLGKTIAVLAAAAIILSNVLGFLYLGEVLQPTGYLGVSLAVAALMILAYA